MNSKGIDCLGDNGVCIPISTHSFKTVKKQTRADVIRSMNDEELAEFLCNISMCKPDYCPAYDTCMRTEHGTMKKWLQSEVE